MNQDTTHSLEHFKLFTIGVYGFDETSYFAALVDSGIDTFCDIRMRRGLRGSIYSFANSKRLQNRLGELGIRYLHFKDLAPSSEVRDCQKKEDARLGVSKRKRTVLGDAFVRAYNEQYLSNFDSRAFIERLGSDAKAVVLFCVERDPAACHRSLLSARLKSDLSIEVKDLLPWKR